MKTGYKVIDAMTRKPISVGPEKNLQECSQLMAKHDIGSLLVIEKAALLGIISEQDLVRKVISKGANPLTTKVADIMEKSVITITPEKDIEEAIVTMKNRNVRHLPVIDDGKLIGLITLKDVLKIQPTLFDVIVEKMHVREEIRKPVKAKTKEGNCDECGEFYEELNVVDGKILCDRCKNLVEDEED